MTWDMKSGARPSGRARIETLVSEGTRLRVWLHSAPAFGSGED